MKKAIIIFSGYNQRAVIAFIRTLDRQKIEYGIIASSKEDTIFSTIYSKKVLVIREEKQLILTDIIKTIECIKQNIIADKYVIAPSTEALNRFLLENKIVFESTGCEIPLVKQSLYESISDKYKFSKMCTENNILIPNEYNDINEAPFPYVAKPKMYRTEKGSIHNPFIINDEKEKQEFLDQCSHEDFYFQEFITGSCIYLLYYFYKDGTVMKFSQVNKIQQPGGKSMIAAESSDFHENYESSKYEKLFTSTGFIGLVMIEVKKDNEKTYMIEANPRFWGPSQLFVDAGVNFFEAFLFDNGLISKKPKYKFPAEKIKYFWYGGLIDSLRKFNYLSYHDYTKEYYNKEYDDWSSSDVYNRGDTKDLFKQEVNT